MATSVTTASDFPYSQDGPCGVQPGAFYTVLADCANVRHPHRKLRVTVTLPAHPSETISSQRNRTAPYPVVVFFSGFLLKPAYYSAYANRLATWGYACVQYDAGRWPILNDRQELPFFGTLIDWLQTQPELSAVVNTDTIGVAGHSRGAKLAALTLASGNPAVKAAFLVDPVDNTRETPEGPKYPNAAKALQSADKPVAMCGASVITGCNPAGSNWQHFWPIVADGSWLLEVNGASHNTFLRASWLVEKALDLLCKRGPTSHEDTIALAMPAMTAWMDRELRGQSSNAIAQIEANHKQLSPDEGLLKSFYEWVQLQVDSKKVEFTIKGQESQLNTKA